MAESTGAIFTAMGANLAIAVAKFAGAALTGSSSMLSEGIHSVVDTTNQALLLIGLKRAERPPTPKHPFGYGREVYFYSFVVALLIFSAGGIFSIFEGVEKVRHPVPDASAHLFGIELPSIAINLSILGFAILAEGYSFVVAFRALPTKGGSAFSNIRRSKDPSLFVVILEDAAAVAGLVLALAGVGLAKLLDAPLLDGAAAIETHGLLIGEAADPDVVASIEEVVRARPEVLHVNEVLTQHLGPRDILVNLSLDMRDELSSPEIEALVSKFEAKLKETGGVTRVFIEIQSTSGHARAKPRRSA